MASLDGSRARLLPVTLHAYRSLYPVSRFANVFVFPYANNSPACLFELGVSVPIAPNIGLDFYTPPICIVLGPGAVFRAAMPEATIEKHGDPMRWEGDVYRSAASFDEFAMQSKTQTSSVQF